MALITCPECGKEISSDAASCPHCGKPRGHAASPVQKKSQPPGCVIVLLVVGGIIVLLAMLGGGGSKKSDGDDPIMACLMAQDFVKKRLRAPSTAEFSTCAGDNVATKDASGIWSTSGYVDSQNGFGAKLRSNYSARLHFIGNDEWQSDDVQLYEL